MPHELRTATPEDRPALERLIDASVRELSRGFYTAAQIDSALRYVVGPDTRLIADGTYYVLPAADGLAAAGGWSRRCSRYDRSRPAGRDRGSDQSGAH